ncbi:MAG: peptidoglycan DD-metalloendopeptidase family protein [Alistipes sp.]|nr:peptidoglycan DD-metalloendopeptidase family protein [Alistipes sp.]
MKRLLYTILAATIAVSFSACSSKKAEQKRENILFGINADNYNIERHTVERGDSWSKILENYGIGTQKVLRLDQLTKNICPLRTIRAGSHYTTFTRQDSTAVQLDYLVYEKNLVDYVVFAFVGDSVAVREGQREVEIRRKKSSATISTSLWGAIMEAELPYSLASEMEDIYQWTVDFFGIQQGDSFTVIYDEKFIDTLSVGVGRIWGAKFTHRGKDIYAIPFEQGGKLQYWEEDGGSLRKQLLKAPLKFTRISSKFSHARFHPVLKKYRPHHGVDYAAPVGTPVRAVADGTVTKKSYDKAAGNMLKIKHPGNLSSGYLHLRGFAKGIKVGARVSQGQIIGYVGSTGRSTGPHLDFRLWKGSTPINPLKVPQKPSEPISKDNRERFEWVRTRVMAELNGEVPDSMKITNLEMLK